MALDPVELAGVGWSRDQFDLRTVPWLPLPAKWRREPHEPAAAEFVAPDALRSDHRGANEAADDRARAEPGRFRDLAKHRRHARSRQSPERSDRDGALGHVPITPVGSSGPSLSFGRPTGRRRRSRRPWSCRTLAPGRSFPVNPMARVVARRASQLRGCERRDKNSKVHAAGIAFTIRPPLASHADARLCDVSRTCGRVAERASRAGGADEPYLCI